MNDPHLSPDENDPLAAELARLRPRPLSPDFAERLARRLEQADQSPPSPQLSSPPASRQAAWLSLVAVAALALIALVVLRSDLLRKGREPAELPTVAALPEAAPPGIQQRGVSSAARSAPTLFAYQMALADPQGGLDRLLEEHASRLLPDVGGPQLAATPAH